MADEIDFKINQNRPNFNSILIKGTFDHEGQIL